MTLVATKYKHNERNTMMIDWYIGKRCNFSCSYCADFIHDNYSAYVPFNKMKIFVDKIVERYGTNIHWSITGGEPTLNPDLIQLLEYLQDKKYQISICTNGSRTIEYLYQMYELVDNITYSLHFEHIANDLTYREKAIQLEQWRVNWNKNIPADQEGWELGQIQPKQFIARMMVLPGFNKEVEDYTEYFKDIERIEHRVIRPQPEYFVEEYKEKQLDGTYRWKLKQPQTSITKKTKVSPDQNNTDDFTEVLARELRWYSDADRDTLSNLYKNVKPERKWLRGFIEQPDGTITTDDFHYNSLNYEYKTNFEGWTCNAGVTLLKVAPNGDIFIANCYQGGALGNIFDEVITLPTEPVICKKNRCTDPMDLRQSKYKETKYKGLIE